MVSGTLTHFCARNNVLTNAIATVLLELNLPAGTYIVIPAIFQAGKEASFSFTVYGSDDFGFTAL